jgi:hypothetical protein
MHRVLPILVSGLLLLRLISPGNADEPASPPEPRTFTVACKLVRKVLFNNSEGKRELETIESKIDLTSLEGTSAEYHSGGKVATTPFGFQLCAKVTAQDKTKVRLEVQVEDSSTDGVGLNPVIHSNRQRVVRQLHLGKVIKLELNSTKDGEGVWVELTVQEAPEE